ncbi:hypothetical protein CDD82_2392 [Ophiocordyceps australis]|uniref:N-acetyltransferase domain-containing protein n=1 Tax=Ophiocordyceps australis TaxID=1399860 RepID=A0A2C5YMW3_9HYPO|nr:hypothetical protein CDD82_2392 [Ophiocordyceps australis]
MHQQQQQPQSRASQGRPGVAQPTQPQSLIPSAWHTTIRHVSLKERDAAGLALAYSFAADPLSVYLLSGDKLEPEQAWKLHVRIMAYTFAAYRLEGIVTALGPDYDAIAMWTPPGKFMDGCWTTLRSGTWRLAYQLPSEARRRFFDELVPALHNTRERVMGSRNNDCYYLGYIGTKPSARGKGYASKLIQSMTDKADAENRPIYLESSAQSNIGYYTKFGFRIKDQIELKRAATPVLLYCMVREPQGGQLQASSTESSNDVDKPEA